jgi:hypothetical protein
MWEKLSYLFKVLEERYESRYILIMQDFLAQELQKAREEERKRIAKIVLPIVVGFIHRVDLGIARTMEAYRGMKKIRKLLDPTPVTSSETK